MKFNLQVNPDPRHPRLGVRGTLLVPVAAALWASTATMGWADELIPCDPDAGITPMMVGDIFSCEIESSGDSDVFTIDVVAGDIYLLTLVDRDNAGNDPLAEVFDCGGSPFATIAAPNLGGAALEFEGPCEGTLNVLISDAGNSDTGPYHFALQRISPLPGEALEICVDCELDASISPAGDSDMFFFQGQASSTIIFSAADRDNAGVDPLVSIRTPSGGDLIQLAPPNLGGTRQSVDLPASGDYTFVVSDNGNQDTGPYALAVQQLFPTPPTAAEIDFDQTITDTIAPVTDSDLITFTGIAGDTVRITATDLDNAALDPLLEVYAPDGTLLVTLTPPNLGGTFEQLSLTQTGTYTLAMFDSGINDTGSYSINLQCVFGTCFGTPELELIPDRLNFGTIDVGEVSASGTIVVRNVGDADLVVTNSLMSNNPVFVLSNDNCSLASLPPLGECSFDAAFAPIANGRVFGRVTLITNDPNTPEANVLLIGTGANAPPADPIGGDVFGATVTNVRCTNLATNQTVVISDGLSMYDCVAAGLIANPGDPLRILINAAAE